MKAAFFLGNESFDVVEQDIPEVSNDEVLIRNKFCGVCGTDVHIYFGEPGSADVNPPVVLGHEYSGVVVKTGMNVKNITVGSHVTVDPNIYCGECIWCRNGKKQMCPNMQAVGVTRNGGFEEYSVVPKEQVFRLDDNVPFEYAAMAEPLACCIHGIDTAQIKTGDNVVIVGGGAIGLIMAQLAKLSGAAKVVVSEPVEQRRNAACEIGADLTVDPINEDIVSRISDFFGEPGADVVIECVGNVAAVDSAVKMAKKGGTIVLFSVPKIGSEYSLDLFSVYKKELTIKGSFVNPDTHQRAVNLINSGRINFKPIITHKYSIDEIEEAIKMQMSNDSIKVIVEAV